MTASPMMWLWEFVAENEVLMGAQELKRSRYLRCQQPIDCVDVEITVVLRLGMEIQGARC